MTVSAKIKQKKLKKILIAALIVLAVVAAIVPLTVQSIQKQKIKQYFEEIFPYYPFHWDNHGLWYSPYKDAHADPDYEPPQYYVVSNKKVNTQEGFSIEVRKDVVTEGAKNIGYWINYTAMSEQWEASVALEKKMYGMWCDVGRFLWDPGISPGHPEEDGVLAGFSFPLRSDPVYTIVRTEDGEPYSAPGYPDGFVADPGEYRLVAEVKVYEGYGVDPKCVDTFYLADEFTIVPAE